MKLNLHYFRHLTPTDWRVLTAVEMGTKNHEVVPTPLIIQLSGLKTGGSGVHKSISTLAKAGLVARERNMKYDGYRLTYGGYDYLALHSHLKSGRVVHVGSQMGVGKESDIYLITSPKAFAADDIVQSPNKTSLTPSSDPPSSSQTAPQTPQHADLAQTILKIHRLGRTSFRTIKNNRAYHGSRTGVSWQYLSRLSASKEYAAMSALHDAGFPTPCPVGWNRHTVVMSLVPGIPLRTVPLEAFGEIDTTASEEIVQEQKQKRDQRISALFDRCVDLALRLAEVGLIHGDLNEFNMLIENVPDPDSPSLQKETDMIPHLIDFPQITSMSHPDAERYFDRDIQGIKSYFRKRYHFEIESSGPKFKEALERLSRAEKNAESRGDADGFRLDSKIEAMGFTRKTKHSRELEEYYAQSANLPEEERSVDEIDNVEDNDEIDDIDGVDEIDNTDNVNDIERVQEEPNHKAVNGFTTLQILNDTQENNPPEDPTPDISAISLNPKSMSGTKPSPTPARPDSVKKKSAKAAAGWSI